MKSSQIYREQNQNKQCFWWRDLNKRNNQGQMSFFIFFIFIYWFLERERKDERETSICCSTYSCSLWLILVCVLTRGQTHSLAVSRWCFNQQSHPARAKTVALSLTQTLLFSIQIRSTIKFTHPWSFALFHIKIIMLHIFLYFIIMKNCQGKSIEYILLAWFKYLKYLDILYVNFHLNSCLGSCTLGVGPDC